jgi:para-nitrobenzyl esterase
MGLWLGIKSLRWAPGKFTVLVCVLSSLAGYGSSAAPNPSDRKAAAASQAAGPTVQIQSGALRGIYVGSLAVFKGIPYARPPVGNLRWREPQPAEAWRGIKDASHAGSACVQDPAGLTPFLAPMAKAYGSTYTAEPLRSSEDCLYLNVWTPGWPPQHGLPVMVWLHGGSNVVGSGAQSTYDGASMVSHGVILVTINYRLGVLGFFSHPELTAECSHHSSGKYGLLDQLAALGWVQRNIAQFGGDPNNVTLFGESAGAIDAGVLMASPLSTVLFRRVISESGPMIGGGKGTTLAQAEAFGKVVGEAAPGDPHWSGLARLRQMPAPEVSKLVAQVVKTRFNGVDTSSPVADGWVNPIPPQEAFVKGSIQKVDLLVGLNGRELSAFRVAAAAASKAPGNPAPGGAIGIIKKFSETAHPFFGSWTNPAIALYIGNILVHRAVGLDHAANDIVVACPVGAMAALTTAAGQHVYVYRFERTIAGKGEAELGAFHGLEVPYVFGALKDRAWGWLPFGATDQQLSGSIQTYWTNFAKTGNPNSPGLPSWPAWTDEKTEFLEIEKSGAISAQRKFPPLFSSLDAEDLRKSLSTE